MHDVTPLLRVEPNLALETDVDLAVELIESGQRAWVKSDDTAVEVLVRLGLTEAQAADQVVASYGPGAAAVIRLP
jgi:hypothetical protein